MLDIIEHNAVLYYADFLSLKEESITVTDNCKYYFIRKSPINSAYMAETLPFYDVDNKYYIQSYNECMNLKAKLGAEGMVDYVKDVCNLAALGCIDAYLMLSCIHYYSTKYDRNQAFKTYEKWISNQIYTHLEINEKGNPQRTKCTRYVAHAEYGTNTEPRVEYNLKPTKKQGIH